MTDASDRDLTIGEDEQSYRDLGRQMGAIPGFVETLPDQEGRIARGVVDGRRPYEIAMDEGISEQAVWEIVRALANAAMAPSQRALSRGYETSGLGSDTDPGVTGGYGDTGFGSIGNEGGEAVTEEMDEEE